MLFGLEAGHSFNDVCHESSGDAIRETSVPLSGSGTDVTTDQQPLVITLAAYTSTCKLMMYEPAKLISRSILSDRSLPPAAGLDQGQLSGTSYLHRGQCTYLCVCVCLASVQAGQTLVNSD